MKPTILAVIALTVALFCGAQSNYVSSKTTWHMVYSNSWDGWEGPIAVCEISADGSRILRHVPLNYQPFNTNSYYRTNWAVISVAQVTNTVALNTNEINRLATNGTICKVRGHTWGNHIHVTLEYYSGKMDCRECKLCGVHQTLIADWK